MRKKRFLNLTKSYYFSHFLVSFYFFVYFNFARCWSACRREMYLCLNSNFKFNFYLLVIIHVTYYTRIGPNVRT